MGLTKEAFAQLKAELRSALEVLAGRVAYAVRKLLAQHTAELAACSMLQIQQLTAEIYGSYGLQIGDAIRKAVMFGKGDIASHVYYNDGVTWAKLVRMSPPQLKELNDPTHLFDIRVSRNKVLQVRSDRLSDKQSQLLISRWPKVKLLPAHKQDDPRPKLIPHTYYRLIHVEPDTSVRGTVLCVFRQGNSEFKARLHKCDLAQIAAAMPTKRVGSLRAKSS